MARARNIKPGFFTNEDLVELPFSTRLLFIGLWTIADRAGRLEDRPKKIKMAIFPADNIDVDDALNELQEKGFVVRYSVENAQYIQVVAFERHQNPHRDEKQSTIPEPPQHSASTVQAQCKHGGNLADSLIPDSLIPDSLSSPLAVNLEGGGETKASDDDLPSGVAIDSAVVDIDDDESKPRTCVSWFTFFNQRYGQNFKYTSIHDRKALWPIFTRWVNSGITERQVSLAINKAMAEAKSPISNLPAYVDRVLASMNSPPTQAQAKSSGIAASLGLVAGTEKTIVEVSSVAEKARLPNH